MITSASPLQYLTCRPRFRSGRLFVWKRLALCQKKAAQPRGSAVSELANGKTGPCRGRVQSHFTHPAAASPPRAIPAADTPTARLSAAHAARIAAAMIRCWRGWHGSASPLPWRQPAPRWSAVRHLSGRWPASPLMVAVIPVPGSVISARPPSPAVPDIHPRLGCWCSILLAGDNPMLAGSCPTTTGPSGCRKS
jgi:hypothetical protein